MPMNKDRSCLNLLCDMGELTALFTRSSDMEGFLQQAVTMVSDHLGSDVCSIYLYLEGTGELVLKATIGLNPEAVERVRMKPGLGLVGTTFERNVPICDGDAFNHPKFKYFTEAQEDAFPSFLSVPIVRGANRIGVLVVQHRRADWFSETDVRTLRALSAQLAGVLENVRLLMELRNGRCRFPDPAASNQPLLIKGKTVSAGTLFGEAGIFKNSHARWLHVSPEPGMHLDIDDFFTSVEATIAQILAMQNRFAAQLPESEALIFSAHAMILKDRKFVGQIAEKIRAGMPVVTAVKRISRRYIDLFEESPHDYLKQKALDMEDLAGRLIRNLVCRDKDPGPDIGQRILIAETLHPSEILKFVAERVRGVILVSGGVASHVSILARSLKLPLIIAADRRLLSLDEKTPILMDGDLGNIHVRPEETVVRQFEKRNRLRQNVRSLAGQMRLETRTRDGCRVHLLANVNLLADLHTARDLKAEGVGLYRTEFPFLMRGSFPTEEEQYAVYRKLCTAMAGRPVALRTLDIGGEKAMCATGGPREANPELGLRSIRFSLRHRGIFVEQLRAILRAAAHTDALKIMFPLVSSMDEFRQAKAVLAEALRSLESDGLPHHRQPAVGIMVELPATVEIIHELAREADFFTVGTNDLIQYMIGVDRANEGVAEYYRPDHPAILRALFKIAAAALGAGIGLTVCGEMAHQAEYLPFLVGIGVRSLSMDPQFLPAVQEAIGSIETEAARHHARRMLSFYTLEDTRRFLNTVPQGDTTAARGAV